MSPQILKLFMIIMRCSRIEEEPQDEVEYVVMMKMMMMMMMIHNDVTHDRES